MHKHDLNELIEFDDERFHPKVLLNEPGYRMVLLTMRTGQSIPEHTALGILTIHAIVGRITFFSGSLSCELRAGQAACIGNGVPHRLEAHEDSALLVLITGEAESSADRSEKLDRFGQDLSRPFRC
jgi:quercetin dioxygenase-like cupin family protein